MPPSKSQLKLERVAHIAMGFGARLVYLDYLLFMREAVTQWPPANDQYPVLVTESSGNYYSAARVLDMLCDMGDYLIGAYIAEVFRWLTLGLAFWRCL
jgi:hypothetical protein